MNQDEWNDLCWATKLALARCEGEYDPTEEEPSERFGVNAERSFHEYVEAERQCAPPPPAEK